ncbi:hypothetical protein LTR08_007599 [Meristemomyces frigidus]|nr:hypothetical protein LTR08_007599 [Meristemomyces frigidus]
MAISSALAAQETGYLLDEHYTIEEYVRRRVGYLSRHPDYAHVPYLFPMVRRAAEEIFKSEYERVHVLEVRRREQTAELEDLLPLPTTDNTQTLAQYGSRQWLSGVMWPSAGPATTAVNLTTSNSPNATFGTANNGVTSHTPAPPRSQSGQSTLDRTSPNGQIVPPSSVAAVPYTAGAVEQQGPRRPSLSAQAAPAMTQSAANTCPDVPSPQQTSTIDASGPPHAPNIDQPSTNKLAMAGSPTFDGNSTAATAPMAHVQHPGLGQFQLASPGAATLGTQQPQSTVSWTPPSAISNQAVVQQAQWFTPATSSSTYGGQYSQAVAQQAQWSTPATSSSTYDGKYSQAVAQQAPWFTPATSSSTYGGQYNQAVVQQAPWPTPATSSLSDGGQYNQALVQQAPWFTPATSPPTNGGQYNGPRVPSSVSQQGPLSTPSTSNHRSTEQRTSQSSSVVRVANGVAALANRGMSVPVKVKPGKKKVAATATAQSDATDSVLGEAPIDRHNAEVAADIEAKRQKYSKKRAAPQPSPEIDASSTIINNDERTAQTPEGTPSPAKKLKTLKGPRKTTEPPAKPNAKAPMAAHIEAVLAGTALPTSIAEALSTSATRHARLLTHHTTTTPPAPGAPPPDLLPEFFNPAAFPDANQVRCACGVAHDDGARMIACRGCGVWQHTLCMGVTDARRKFACQVCEPWRHRELVARLRVAGLQLP